MLKKRYIQYFLFAAAVTAICWDMAVSILDIVSGTFRYESEFDALSGATTKVGIVTSDYAELSDPVDRTINPSYEQIDDNGGSPVSKGVYFCKLESGRLHSSIKLIVE